MNEEDAVTRPVQYFTREYLAQCRAMTAEQICVFLDGYRQLTLGARSAKRKAISIRVQEHVLRAFKAKARAEGIPYQTQIHRLMEAWLRAK